MRGAPNWRGTPSGGAGSTAATIFRTRPFHDRMPVILDWRDAGAWIAGESPGALLRPAPDDALREWIVSKRVNKAGAGDDDPALIEPIDHA
jgi:putative SOS response-associated peptidase YedK